MHARAAASECRPPELVTAKREEPPACAERTADRPGPRGRGSGRLPLSHSLLPDCDVDLATGPSQSVDPPWNDFTAALDHVIDDGLSQEHNTRAGTRSACCATARREVPPGINTCSR